MNDYTNYVIAAYAVFFVVLGWDFIATRLQIRRELRNARLRAARVAARTSPDPTSTDLTSGSAIPGSPTSPNELTR